MKNCATKDFIRDFQRARDSRRLVLAKPIAHVNFKRVKRATNGRIALLWYRTFCISLNSGQRTSPSGFGGSNSDTAHNITLKRHQMTQGSNEIEATRSIH